MWSQSYNEPPKIHGLINQWVSVGLSYNPYKWSLLGPKWFSGAQLVGGKLEKKWDVVRPADMSP